jgi:hypothetical protein
MSLFKKGLKVRYCTPRGRDGYGKIVEVIETARGLWYVVADAATKTQTKVRAAGLAVAAA